MYTYIHTVLAILHAYIILRDPGAFQATCGRTKTTDDLTIGAIISNTDLIWMKSNELQ